MAPKEGLRVRSHKPKAPRGDDKDWDPKLKPSQHGGSPNARRWALVAFLGTVSLLVILFPQRALQIVQPWYDASEKLPGTSKDPFFGPDISRRDAVVEAFKHAWHAYERDAFGADEYHPLSHTGSNLTECHGYGYTIVDTLDTMLLMHQHEEYARARKWVEEKLDFNIDGIYNVFETTIRVLGGLLSAYHLSSHDDLYLTKAVDLADRLMVAFVTPSGLPTSMVNLGKREAIPDTQNNNRVSTAEVATLQLEFRYLSEITGDDTYWRAAENVMKVIDRATLNPALPSIFMDPDTGSFVISPIRLGSRGDSYYEYLLKQYLQTSGTEPGLRRMYDTAMDAVTTHLFMRTPHSNFLHTAELQPEGHGSNLQWRLVPKQDHLVCFLGGSLMLGAVDGGGDVSVPPLASELSSTAKRDWKSGFELIRTCMETHQTATGLSPEIAHFRTATDPEVVASRAPKDWYIKGTGDAAPSWDARYSLRPETVESLFIAFRLTGDRRYRNWGWQIFQAIESHCKVQSGGYASVLNVDSIPVTWDDKMETFLLSETLKYLYLLFEDSSVVPLTENVFNTEAHPLPIFTPSSRTAFS